MIKKIHYIWLGGNPKSRLIKKCIKSWQKHMPDWEIIEWNESNLNIDINTYCRQAYDAKKYAFASDVLRFDILYREGGLYFDIDVKMLKNFETLVQENEAFCGFENNKRLAPGLVLYAKQLGNPIYKQIVDLYSESSFIKDDGSYNLKVVGDYFYDIVSKYGIVLEDKYQKIDNMTIFPSEYFCPTDGIRSVDNYTPNTYSVHLYAATWVNKQKKRKDALRKFFYTALTPKGVKTLKKIVRWR